MEEKKKEKPKKVKVRLTLEQVEPRYQEHLKRIGGK